MGSSKILSIIVPIFNAEQFLSRCIDSIYKNAPYVSLFEVIAVNDGSSDKSLQILNEYRTEYENLVIINQSNLGVSSARNTGINAAKGKYVLFLDADDELIDGSLERLCSYLLENKSIDMLVTRQETNIEGETYFDKEPNLIEHNVYSGLEAYHNRFVRTNAGGGICRIDLLKKNCLEFPVGVTNGEDTIFFAQVQVYAQSIVYYNLRLYQINVIGNSATRSVDSSKGKRLLHAIKTANRIKNSLTVENERKGIFEYAIYQLISNTVAFFAESRELSYLMIRREIEKDHVLPLNTHYMCMMRGKAQLMNISFPFFYFLSWLKIKVTCII